MPERIGLWPAIFHEIRYVMRPNHFLKEFPVPESTSFRFHDRLQDYWEKLKGDRPFPSESDIDPEELPDIWPSCFLVAIDDVTRRMGYRFSYLGEDLIEAYGDDVTNPDLALRLISQANTSMVKKFDEVIRTGKPVIAASEFVNLKRLKIRYRTCLLPLGAQDGTISYIIGCMRWKIY